LIPASHRYRGDLAGSCDCGTSDPALYLDARYDDGATPELQYSFAVPAGRYQVKIALRRELCARINVRARVFDVQMEGRTVFSGLDITGKWVRAKL